MPRNRLAIAVILMLALAACAPKTPSANSAVASKQLPAAANPNTACYAYASTDRFTAATSPYPDWARAEFPPYRNAKPSRCFEFVYEFRTGDDPATVLAWYKAHSTTHWATSEGPSRWEGWRKDVHIFIAAPTKPVNGVNTVIEIEPYEM
jgi:hypothetical protein